MVTAGSGGSGQQTQWLYLIDTKSRSFALYRIDPMNSKGIVKLEASRQYEWDLKLEHYNNQPPEPDAIKATVQTLSRSDPNKPETADVTGRGLLSMRIDLNRLI